MKESKVVIILGTAHLATTPGKKSPDGRFQEYAYSRETVKEIAEVLRADGFPVFIDYMPADPSVEMRGVTPKQEQSRELTWRVNFVNSICSKYGKSNCLYLSIHTNAAGNGREWCSARGFSVHVSPKASEASKRLARCLYETAEREGKDVTGNRATPPDKYWVQDLRVLNDTACPAVLTENLFQDNKEDVDYLLSERGRAAIVRLHVNGIKEFVAKYCGM